MFFSKNRNHRVSPSVQSITDYPGRWHATYTLSHDRHQVVEYAINQLQNAGYRLVTVAECLGEDPYQSVAAPQSRTVSYHCFFPSWWSDLLIVIIHIGGLALLKESYSLLIRSYTPLRTIFYEFSNDWAFDWDLTLPRTMTFLTLLSDVYDLSLKIQFRTTNTFKYSTTK